MKLKGYLAKQDWGGFILSFLSVFLGIVLTFAGQAWIDASRERKEVKEALHLVKQELLDNVRSLSEIQDQVELENRAAHYLMRYYDRFEQCERDSMILYCNAPLTINNPALSKDALELLKTSSLLQKISDKELALAIIRAYNALESEKEAFLYYFEKKQKLLDAAMQEEAKALFARESYTAAQMWTALTSTVEGRQFLHEITISVYYGFGHDEFSEYVESVVDALDEYID